MAATAVTAAPLTNDAIMAVAAIVTQWQGRRSTNQNNNQKLGLWGRSLEIESTIGRFDAPHDMLQL
jgi:hypothetical protein